MKAHSSGDTPVNQSRLTLCSLTASSAELWQGIGPDQITGELERIVDDIVTGNTNPADNFIRVIALIRDCSDEDTRELLINKILEYAYARSEDNSTAREEYIKKLRGPITEPDGKGRKKK
jgi:hypothetical protein